MRNSYLPISYTYDGCVRKQIAWCTANTASSFDCRVVVICAGSDAQSPAERLATASNVRMRDGFVTSHEKFTLHVNRDL